MPRSQTGPRLSTYRSVSNELLSFSHTNNELQSKSISKSNSKSASWSLNRKFSDNRFRLEFAVFERIGIVRYNPEAIKKINFTEFSQK